MFPSLRVKDFRIYWIGMFISLIGSWIQIVASSWLVYELTRSEFWLGLVGFLGSLPMSILSLLGGVAADNVSKRKILIITQVSFMFLALALGLLTALGKITVWHIVLLSVLQGITMAFDAPARQAVVVDIVGKKNLFNAIVLNSVAFNSSRMIGPALAGIIVSLYSMSACFFINAATFLAVIAALLRIKVRHTVVKTTFFNLKEDIKIVLEFVRKNRIILVLLVLVAVSSLFGISYAILMPALAQKVLGTGVKGLGGLMSSSGVGALLAGFILAKNGELKNKGKVLLSTLFLFSCSLILLAFSKVYLLSVVALVFIGASSMTAISLINTILQSMVEDSIRGKIVSLFMMTFGGMMPFGSLFSGIIAHFSGVSVAILLNGIICLLFFGVITLKYPKILEL